MSDCGLESGAPQAPSAHERFPETVHPVLARLEAEVEMCEDRLQQSRLAAILDALKRFAPSGAAADEVPSDS